MLRPYCVTEMCKFLSLRARQPYAGEAGIILAVYVRVCVCLSVCLSVTDRAQTEKLPLRNWCNLV